jgi:hypothetical protein
MISFFFICVSLNTLKNNETMPCALFWSDKNYPESIQPNKIEENAIF